MHLAPVLRLSKHQIVRVKNYPIELATDKKADDTDLICVIRVWLMAILIQLIIF
jgi:hypothetical protein